MRYTLNNMTPDYICIFLIISIFWQGQILAIKILVEPVIYKRSYPYNTDLNFSKDWTNECDVPCVWTGDPFNIDGVFYVIRNNWDVISAYMSEERERAPITIGGSTEAKHHFSLLSNYYFRRIFTASALLASDSEIPWTIEIGDYRELRKVEPNPNPLKMAVITMSHCDSKNSREQMVMELDQIMPVVRIGKCLNNRAWPECHGRECTELEALRRYAFCLAFENGNSPGYVTELVFDCHRAGSIPVYLGPSEVLKFVPKGSIIYAGDFKTSFDLAYYLVEVATNETLYQSYFDWKRAPLDPEFVRRNKQFWDYKIQCRVCRYVWVVQQGLTWDPESQNVSSETRGRMNLDLDLSEETNTYNQANARLRPRSERFEIQVEKESISTQPLPSYIYLLLSVLTLVLFIIFSPCLKILRVRIFSHIWLLKGKLCL